jgi:hypothetical protein
MQNRKIIAIGLAVLIGLICLVSPIVFVMQTDRLLFGNVPSNEYEHFWANDPKVRLVSRVPIGTTRDETLKILSDAWYRADCRYSNGEGPELFFFGDKNPKKALLIEVSYKSVDNVLLVDNIGSLENDMLHLYGDCIPSDVFGLAP